MKRHPIDPFSLIAGIFVTVIAIAALTGPWSLEVGVWAWPATLIVAGVVIIGLVLVGQRGRDADRLDADGGREQLDPERADALSAAYAELDDDMSIDEPESTVDA